MPKEAAKDAHFIKELTFKAKQATNLNNTFRFIKELRKRVTMREKQTALEADLVVQESLQLIRTGKIHRCQHVASLSSLVCVCVWIRRQIKRC